MDKLINERLLLASKRILTKFTGEEPPDVDELRQAIAEVEGGEFYSVSKILNVPRQEITTQTFNHLNNFYTVYQGNENIVDIREAFRQTSSVAKINKGGKAIEIEVIGLYELAYRYGCEYIRFNG
jgi:hypothetical protein